MAALTREDRRIAAEKTRQSWQMKGFETSPEVRALHERWVEGELTSSELVEETKRPVGIA